MYGMAHKTTIYLSDELKAAVEREAQLRQCSEASVIREAIAAAVHRSRPRAGFLEGEAFAERVDEVLPGFGER